MAARQGCRRSEVNPLKRDGDSRARVSGSGFLDPWLFSTIGPAGARLPGSMAIPRALVPTDSRMGIPDLTYANAPCSRPLLRMIVRHDGEMCNCCEDLHGDFKLGNVYQRSLEDLWFSGRHMKIVADLIAGHREKYSLCRNCPLSPTSPASDKMIDFRARHYSGR
jgi:radical SAM protein with 4Fe4S-binding SPASM domain